MTHCPPTRVVSGLAAALMMVVPAIMLAAPPLPGAIFTTDSNTCAPVNLNIYADKGDVYLDGGPSHPGAAGLPDGSYYVQVTEPGGTLLGTSVGSGNATPVSVSGGEFVACYQLSSILIKASDSTPGYDTTANPGGEYKVWVSAVSTFDNDSTKTDNFKVKSDPGTFFTARLRVLKWYDANTNGTRESGEPLLIGWKFRIQDLLIDFTRFSPVDIIVDPGDYSVTELAPAETNWYSTVQTQRNITLGADELIVELEFGNVCVGAGGGLTLGFWSNKNGQALVGADDLALLVSLNLRNALGSDFDPTTYSALRTWLLNGTATNMAYMLSVQLAAMELNVLNGKAAGSSLVYAPGAASANAAGFATVNSVMAEANTELGTHDVTLADSPFRAYQEALKNALDRANNNLTFVQAAPCAYTFAD